MSEESMIVLEGEKNARIIKTIQNLYSIKAEEAVSIFYLSLTPQVIIELDSQQQGFNEREIAIKIMEEYNNTDPKLNCL